MKTAPTPHPPTVVLTPVAGLPVLLQPLPEQGQGVDDVHHTDVLNQTIHLFGIVRVAEVIIKALLV